MLRKKNVNDRLSKVRAYFEDDSDGVARNVDDSLGDDNDETLLLNCAGGDNHDRIYCY